MDGSSRAIGRDATGRAPGRAVDGLEDADRGEVRDHRRAPDRDERQRNAGDRGIPIVIPTLTKIWKSSAKTMPPATIAENASGAIRMIRTPRQSTSR